MIKVILIAALAISAYAVGSTAATCTGTYTQCAGCTQAAQVTATTAEVCATCNTGFSLPSTLGCTGSGCSATIANCQSCASATPTVCSACMAGYIIDTTNNVCVSCSTATSGYTGAAGTGVTACTVTSSKVISATSCLTAMGYALDATNSVCVNCGTGKAVTGTLTYNSFLANSQCTISGSSVVASGCALFSATDPAAGCGPCTGAVGTTYGAGDANALTCAWSGATPYTFALKTCTNGYVADTTNNVCVSCSTGKTTSSAATAATYTSFLTGATACTLTGTKISAASACSAGYGLDTTNNACINCQTGKGASTGGTTYAYTGSDANCASCTSTASAVACTSCNTGSYLFYNGTCGNGTVNDTNCQYFSNQVHCVQCKPGYYTAVSNNCVTCPSNCNGCDSTGKICSVCSTGYKLSTTAAGTCVPSGANIIVPGFALLSVIFYYLF